MSPFRAGDENYPPDQQSFAIKNDGLGYPPAAGSDADDAGKDFLNDYSEKAELWDEIASYKKQKRRLEDEKLRHLVEERSIQKHLDAGAETALADSLMAAAFLEQAALPGLPRFALPLESRANGFKQLRSRIEERDNMWTKGHKDTLNHEGIEALSGLKYELVPDDVLSPILINDHLSQRPTYM